MAMEDLKGMLQGMIDKKKADKETADLERQQKNDGDRNKILENISGDLSKSLAPVLEQLAKNSKLSTDDIRQALAEAIEINLPEMKMPDIPAPVVNVPAPIVNVSAPHIPAPIVKVSPTPVTFPEEMSLKAGNRPFPVIMMDQGGKPMQFPQMSGGATGGRSDFFAIRDIQTSAGASIIDQVDGAMKVVGSFSVSASNSSTQAIDASLNPYNVANPFPVQVVSGGTATSASNIVDSSGVAYSGSNPLPTTATITLPFGPGDGATATRFIQAGDTVSSVIVNSGTITTVTTLTSITNSVAAALVDSGGVQYSASNPITALVSDVSASLKVALTDSSGVQYSGSNPVPITGTVTAVTGITNSIQVVQLDRDGNPFQPFVYGPGEMANSQRVLLAGDSAASVVVNSGTLTTVTTLTSVTNSVAAMIVDSGSVGYSGSNPLPVTLVSGALTSMLAVGDSAHRAADNGGNPVKIGGIAVTTLPTAYADGDRADFTSDKRGRQITRPIQVRDLVSTAYVSLTTGTEATLLAATAGATYDLIWVMLSNQSTAAVQVDVRPVLAGNVAMTFQVPANGTVGIAPPVPLPGATDSGNAWTVDIPDITGTTVNISALFSREV